MNKLFNGRHFVAFEAVPPEVWEDAVYDISRRGRQPLRNGLAAAFRVDQKKLKAPFYSSIKAMGPREHTFVKDRDGKTWEVAMEVQA